MKIVIGQFLKSNGWDKRFVVFLYLFVVSLPIGHGLDAIMMIPVILCYLFVSSWKEKWNNLKENKITLILLFSIPILFLLGMLYSNNIGVGLGRIERNLPFLVLPIIILSVPKRLIEIRNIFYALGIGLLVVMLISWGIIIADIFSKVSPMKQAKYFFEWIYTDKNLLLAADIHPGYFVLFLILFLTSIMYSELLIDFRRNKTLYFLTLSLFVLFLVETSSRIGVSCLLIIMTINLLRNWNGNRKWLHLIVFCGLFLALIKFDYLSSKFLKLMDINGNITFERYFRWQKIWKVFVENGNMLIGVGTGDVYEVYGKAYEMGEFQQAIKENYNAHNQYLELLVGQGFLGLIVYLLILVNFVLKTRLKDMALAFIVLIIVFSFTESLLVRSKGIMFFAFFYPLFIKQYSSSKNEA